MTTPVAVCPEADIAAPRVLVSLTTIHARLHNLERCLRSLIDQTRKADEIHLFLSAEPFMLDRGVPRDDIPAHIRKLDDSGQIAIRYTRNIGSYRKLIPILRERYSDHCLIVTADDDALYPPDWLDGCVREYYSNPSRVVAYRCRHMQVVDGRIRPYATWRTLTTSEPGSTLQSADSRLIFPTGRGGILYDPRFFRDSVFDEKCLELAPNDDIWFKFHTMVNGVGVACIRSVSQPEFPYDTEHEIDPFCLWEQYNGNPDCTMHNDIQIANVLDYLGISREFWSRP